MQWLAESDYNYIGEHGAVIKLNGNIIADSREHDNAEMADRCNVEVGALDNVDVIVVPKTGLEWWVIALIAVGATAVAIALAPTPELPNDSGRGKSSPNNQLNAANNTFRPREMIPDISGEVVSYPDFIQRSFYTYNANLRTFTELFCIGVGEYTVEEVRDGTTPIDSLDLSEYEVYPPNTPVPSEYLIDVREAEGSVDLVLKPSGASGENESIDSGYISAITVQLGNTAEYIINQLQLAEGDDIQLDLNYTQAGTSYFLSQQATITFVGSDYIEISTALPESDPNSVNGLITKLEAGGSPPWFVLDGKEIEEVRFQLYMPQGVRKGDGSLATVSCICEVEEVDSNGTPVSGGTTGKVRADFTGDTQTPQYQTKAITGLTPSRYRARVFRSSPSLGNNSADLLRCERIESVTPYSADFGDVTILRTKRSSSSQQGRGSSSKVNALVTRKLELFDPLTGTFDTGNFTETRSFAQYVMYALNKAGVPIGSIDYQALFDIESNLIHPRLGYFDFTFDDEDISVREIIKTACNVARVKYYNVANLFKFVREEAQQTRSALFCRRNLAPSKSQQNFSHFIDGDYDSIELKYIDPIDNVEVYVRRRISSSGAIEEGEGQNVKEINLAGCRNALQATNRADLEIRRLRYQRYAIRDVALSDALNVGVGERIAWCDINDSEIQSGEILEVDGNIYTTSEKLDFSQAGNYYCYVTDDQGNVSNSVQVDHVSGDEYKFEAFGSLTTYTADGYERQMGSLYVIVREDDLEAIDFVLTKRGAVNENGEVEIEASVYDERMFDFPVPKPLALTAGGTSETVNNTSCVAVSVELTSTATDGQPPYSYEWSKVSGDSVTFIDATTDQNPTVSFDSVCPQETDTATFEVVVTDGSGDQESAQVTVTAQNTAAAQPEPAPEPEPEPQFSVNAPDAGSSIDSNTCDTVSVSPTCSVNGGVQPYTFQWSKVSGEGSIVSGATSQTCSVEFTNVCPSENKSGVYKVVVTDANSATVEDTCNVQATNINFGQ